MDSLALVVFLIIAAIVGLPIWVRYSVSSEIKSLAREIKTLRDSIKELKQPVTEKPEQEKDPLKEEQAQQAPPPVIIPEPEPAPYVPPVVRQEVEEEIIYPFRAEPKPEPEKIKEPFE